MEKELEINGMKYRLVETVSNNYRIVRTKSAGVFAGNLISLEGDTARVENARRLWFWSGAASLSQLSIDGLKNPSNCKFPEEVEWVILNEVIEILPCTEKAINSIKGVPIWKV